MSYIATGVDLETTGFKQEDGHRIVEIALSVYRTDDFRSFEKFGRTWCQRVNPLRNIDKGAQNAHGISIEDLRGEPEWEEVAKIAHRILSKTHLFVAHNVGFDAPFLAGELERVGLRFPDMECFCTMENGRASTAMGKLPNLGELCWAYGVDYDAADAHAADYDIDRTMRCFVAGVERGRFILPATLTEIEEVA